MRAQLCQGLHEQSVGLAPPLHGFVAATLFLDSLKGSRGVGASLQGYDACTPAFGDTGHLSGPKVDHLPSTRSRHTRSRKIQGGEKIYSECMIGLRCHR